LVIEVLKLITSAARITIDALVFASPAQAYIIGKPKPRILCQNAIKNALDDYFTRFHVSILTVIGPGF
ncbi:MAG: hypothetical protein SVR81_10620, partial [Chloroflexota bacterium]|nr:hypothetical protein [Chloroflexota bacterium]